MSEPVLVVEGLCKVYGRTAAVDDVGFVLAAGESLGIVGESGSGKTTTARMLVGLEQPTAGVVRIAGVGTGGSRRERRLGRARAIQMIFQDPYQSFDRRLTVAESIADPLRLHALVPAARRGAEVARLLDMVGLSSGQGEAKPAELSGGQRQRAAIARALGIRPRVLVLDEAVAALDVSIQAQVLALLDDIRRETGVSYVFVSHDLAVIRYLTDRALVMRRGRVLEQGATEQLLASPAHPYTRLLLDSIPVPGWDLDALADQRRSLDSLDS